MKYENPSPFFIVIIFIVIAVFLINFNSSKHSPENIRRVVIARQNIKVDLALTPAQQERGLSGRQGLKEDEGMLFVFKQPGKYDFWMKNMNFLIDIIWIDENLRVVYIKKDARPDLILETYGSDKAAKYVLEVVAGFSDTYNLKEGDRVSFTY